MEVYRMKDLIMIVDDTIANLQVLGSHMTNAGYDVVCVTKWEEAKDFLETELPYLILLDIMMPEVDGIQACELLKKDNRTKNIPVIFISAMIEMETKIKGFEAGGVDYITKPFQKEEVLIRVRTHIQLNKAMEKIKKNELELKSLINAREKFLSILAHDLKNPLTAAKGIVELLCIKEKRTGDKEKLKSLEHVLTAVSTVTNLTENLLKWIILQQKGVKINKEKFNVKEKLQECFDVYKYNLYYKGINYKLVSKEDIFLNSDIDMFLTVFRNLISNAIKFTDLGGEISANVKKYDEKIEIHISDSGIGMNDDNIKKLLEANENFTTIGTMKEKGTGLGFSICKEMIEKNNGEVFIDSKKGKGTTIVVIYFLV
jgi:two-component system sensor histidine kinase/response regulator